MLIDGRSVPRGSEREADLCIIGAGAAGITLALQLARAKFRVLILESGGLEPEAQTQMLAAGEIGGIGYVPLVSARIRAFGGSTGHWAGWCRPFESIDFEARPWVPHSGWPIGLAELEKYYPRAQEICELGPYEYDPARWDLAAAPVLPLAGNEVTTRLIQFSGPTRFGTRYREAVLAAPSVDLCIYSNVTELEPTENGRELRRVHVRTLSGNQFTVRAKRFVLAAGGIDNARVLLASNQIVNTGVANANDVVGRYFADHIQLDTAGIFPLKDEVPFNLYLGEDRTTRRQLRSQHTNGAPLMGYLTLPESVQRSARTLNYSCKILRTWLSDYYLQDHSQDLTTASAVTKTSDKLHTIFNSLSEAASIAAHRLVGKEQTFYKIVTTQEQAPNPQSRVVLGADRDALGMRVARLEWQLTELDRYTIKQAVTRIVQAFSVNGLARLHVPIDLDSTAWPSSLGCSWHHCGTTRMHADPRYGVVDADSKVHGMSNFYIAGSSVFTTNGHGNPTLTVVALSLRLADTLSAAFNT